MEITNSNELNAKASYGSPVGRIDTADTITLPRDVFESLYLNPERRVAGDLRSRVSSTRSVLWSRHSQSCFAFRE